MATKKTKKHADSSGALAGASLHTPLMRQWLELKAQAGSSLLFFRVGDFYELFWEDAEEASRLLDLTLTRRGSSGGRDVVMSGVPWHSIDTHLARLMRLGRSAAVADQIGDPATAVGPVERAITRVATPGTLIDESLLSARRDAPLLCVSPVEGGLMALFELTLSASRARLRVIEASELADQIERIAPAEILCPEGFSAISSQSLTSSAPAWHFEASRGERLLLESCQAHDLAQLGVDERSALGLGACAGALERARQSLGGKTPLLEDFQVEIAGRVCRMDAPTRRSLEIETTQRGEESPTLLSALDRCSSAPGSRRLRQWLRDPLVEAASIEARHEAVAALIEQGEDRFALREALRGLCDLERVGARAQQRSSRPRDFSNARDSLALIGQLPSLLERAQARSPLLRQIGEGLVASPELLSFLRSAVRDEPSVFIRDGGVIREGWSAELDELRDLASGAQGKLSAIEAREREACGIPTLKIDMNRAHGLSIEITKTHAAKAPSHWRRKLTLKNAERFTTDELDEVERLILSSRERSLALEKTLFEQLQQQLGSHASALLRVSSLLADLDALLCFAEISSERSYCRPLCVPGDRFVAEGLRHPVAELHLSEPFVPNDLSMESTSRALLITGPNMGGKSTLMRSAALCALMAQAGCFAPAARFEWTPRTQIFARVGASDDISRGASTFMVEMSEAAGILRRADSGSLALIDEIGRGTSTFDGMSLAWAILRHLHDVNACLTLFSTHYFELTELAASRLPFSRLGQMGAVLEGDRLVFLRKLLPGAAGGSHGVQVAKIAGIPERALAWARQMLSEIEQAEAGLRRPETTEARSTESSASSVESRPERMVADRLASLDLDAMSPREALLALFSLRDLLGSHS